MRTVSLSCWHVEQHKGSFLYFVLSEAMEFPAQSHISTEELLGRDKTGEVLSRHASLVYKISQQSAFV